MTMAVPVKRGLRYAVGLQVPALGGIVGPFAALRTATENTGFASVGADQPIGQLLAEQGWTNAIVYRRGRAPMIEPATEHDYIAIATRSGDDSTIDTSDPALGGVVLWIQPVTETPQVPARPDPLDPHAPPPIEIPWWAWAILAAVGVGGAVAIATRDRA